MNIVCIVCPRGCHISAERLPDGSADIRGAGCARGTAYAQQEAVHPTRVVTTTVAIWDAVLPRLPVRSASALPKELMAEAVRELRSVSVCSPVRRGDVVAHNVAGSGVDFIATRDM